MVNGIPHSVTMYTVVLVRKIWTAVQTKTAQTSHTSLHPWHKSQMVHTYAQIALESDKNIPLNRLRETKKDPQFQQGHTRSNSEDNIALKTLSHKTRKRKKHDETVSDEANFDDDMVDKDFVMRRTIFRLLIPICQTST